MTEWIKLTASDGAVLEAYVARPQGEPKASLVVVQEIFGVNDHIQGVTDAWAKEGYLAIAPAMFDRIEPGVKIGYDKAGWARAMSFVPRIDMDKSILDVSAAIDWLRNETDQNAGIVGYCYGGTMAWLAAARLDVQAAVAYYGGDIVKFLNDEPRCPVMLHFGAEDAYIPAENIAKIQRAHPEVPIFVYEGAGHAFNRSADPKAYIADAARMAKSRSVLFFQQHLVF